jgi:hypothetical protein
VAFKNEPEYVRGYEEIAQYVVENKKGACVLYSSFYDTGYFVYFIRKHDHDRNLIILRADKILATSNMRYIVEERISDPKEIYEILNKFGIFYVVVNDFRTESQSLEWLRQEVKSDNFILRKQIKLSSNSPRVNNILLSVYEYKNYSPPSPDTMINMNIPLINDSIGVPLNHLISER